MALVAGGPLKILVAGERFHPEEFRVNDLVRDWVARGHQVRVLTQVPSYPHGKVFPGWWNEARNDERWEGATVRRVPTVTGYQASLRRKLLNYLSFALRASLAAWTESFKPDVVFCFNSGPLTSAIPAVVAARRWQVPLVIWTQDVWPDSVWAYGIRRTPLRERLLNGLVRWVYRHAARVLVSCEGFGTALAPYLPAGTVPEHVPNWAELPPTATGPRPWEVDGRLHITFAGTLATVQNLDRLLEAWARLTPGTAARLRLHLVGDGAHTAHLRRRVEKERLSGVSFHPRRPFAEMAPIYEASDGLVVSLDPHPVLQLTLPLKFQAGLAAGRPLLAISDGEMHRVVERERVGLVAAPDSVPAIRGMLEHFAALPEDERLKMGERGRALAERDYRRDRILWLLEEVLHEAAAKRHR